MPIYNDITELIGHTPLVRLNHIAAGYDAELLGKLESHNPLSSVKDRIGLAMIEAAEQSGELRSGQTIVEATSGNTGIALAYIGAVKGYRVLLVMPETMSIERRRLLRAFGAELELTEASTGMRGSIERVLQIVHERDDVFLPRQFENPANPSVHWRTTALELIADTGGAIDVFVAAVGTGGTISGVARRLKERIPKLTAIAVEPASSPLLSGGEAGAHRIQGIGANFIPPILARELIDETICVDDLAAAETTRRLAREEGILCGISAGANVWAALQVAGRPESRGKRIVTVICDTGERYLSTWLFADD